MGKAGVKEVRDLKKEQSYDKGIRNSGAQEVPALRQQSGTKKSTATRGKDLRYGK